MGQKINALSLRQSNNKKWNSKSFVDRKNYAEIVYQDLQIRSFVFKFFKNKQIFVNKCVIKRVDDNIFVNISLFYDSKIFLKSLTTTFRKNLFKFFVKRRLNKVHILKYLKILKVTNTNNVRYKIFRIKIRQLRNLYFKVLFFILKTTLFFLTNCKINLKINRVGFLGLFTGKRPWKKKGFLNLRRKENRHRYIRAFKNKTNIKHNYFLSYVYAFVHFFRLRNANALAFLIGMNLSKNVHNSLFYFRFISWLLKKCFVNFKDDLGIKGVCFQIKGRFNRATRTRIKDFSIGQTSFNSVQTKVSYGFYKSITFKGVFSIKVWFFY